MFCSWNRCRFVWCGFTCVTQDTVTVVFIILKMYNKRVVFWAACFGMLLFGCGLITLGSMATDLKIKFELDEVAAGTLFSILPFGILTGSLLFGPICDRYGYKFLLI